MKLNHILSLVQTGYTTVRVAYNAEDIKTYTFKAKNHLNLQVGDFVVIPSSYKFGITIGVVTDIDETPDINTSAEFSYKWVIQKVDQTEYNATLETEAAFEKAYREIERNRVRNTALAEFRNAFPEGSDERTQIEELLADQSLIEGV